MLCRKLKYTFMINNFFKKNRAVYETKVGKIRRAG